MRELHKMQRLSLQTTSGGLIMTTSGTRRMHDTSIGTVLAVGADVKVR